MNLHVLLRTARHVHLHTRLHLKSKRSAGSGNRNARARLNQDIKALNAFHTREVNRRSAPRHPTQLLRAEAAAGVPCAPLAAHGLAHAWSDNACRRHPTTARRALRLSPTVGYEIPTAVWRRLRRPGSFSRLRRPQPKARAVSRARGRYGTRKRAGRVQRPGGVEGRKRSYCGRPRRGGFAPHHPLRRWP